MASTSSTREAKRAERGTKHIYQKRRMSRALGAVKRKIDVALSNSFGFGGTKASLVIRKVAA